MSDARMKPEDVKPGMSFVDRDPRGYPRVFKVESVTATHAHCQGPMCRTRVRLDRLTNPRMYGVYRPAMNGVW